MKINTGLAAWAMCAASAVAALPADAQTQLDAYRAQCAAYGFAPGSPELAGCVQKLDMQEHQHRCELIAQQARFYCNGGGSDSLAPIDIAANCAQAKDVYQNECQ
ncbi:hypothetical protein [Paraburkholderia sp. GAS348]|uniref:hypothetical protein n=1 Tax=Paraburkholderia sp. GAS348 TaxID=3035132 RepID=UPI003D1FCD69